VHQAQVVPLRRTRWQAGQEASEMPPQQSRVLVVGGSFAGLCVARDLRNHFLVTIVDAKEFFEYTPGILRAYVKPSHLNALTFTLYPVIEHKMGCKFIWGEVLHLNGQERTATIQPMFADKEEVIDFDFCIIAAGCNFGVMHKWGESLWFPTIHAKARPEGSWPHIDERFLEGRRRHILEEYATIQQLAENKSTILVVGAGFIGVEWITELQFYFPNLRLTIIDGLPLPLGPLPAKAAIYCRKYMESVKINQFYETFYVDKGEKLAEFRKKINLPDGADKTYICMGVKSSNFFMPDDILSVGPPAWTGWIHTTQHLAVCDRDAKVWSEDEKGYPRIFAIGDCNFGSVPDFVELKDPNNGYKDPKERAKKIAKWPVPMIPKISYPGEEEAIIACSNLMKVERLSIRGDKFDKFGHPLKMEKMHWPWGAGMFATSLGAHKACFVAGANWEANSGIMCVWGWPCAVQKWFIEWSKTDECKFGIIGRLVWHFVHHTPVHLFGGGPLWGY